MNGHMVRTNHAAGLTRDAADRMINILNGGVDNGPAMQSSEAWGKYKRDTLVQAEKVSDNLTRLTMRQGELDARMGSNEDALASLRSMEESTNEMRGKCLMMAVGDLFLEVAPKKSRAYIQGECKEIAREQDTLENVVAKSSRDLHSLQAQLSL